MKVSKKLYDPRFDSLHIKYGKQDDFIKDRLPDVSVLDLDKENYITLDELQDQFDVSRYQLIGLLKKLDSKPLAVRKNIIDGKRLRGVGKLAYDRKIINKIDRLVRDESSIDLIKEMAKEILLEG